jgi:hypothetical protein
VLEDRNMALIITTGNFVNRSRPRRHLLWNPEQFAPQPQQRLVRTDFPLREISVPTEVERLRHLSLNEAKNEKLYIENLRDDATFDA